MPPLPTSLLQPMCTRWLEGLRPCCAAPGPTSKSDSLKREVSHSTYPTVSERWANGCGVTVRTWRCVRYEGTVVPPWISRWRSRCTASVRSRCPGATYVAVSSPGATDDDAAGDQRRKCTVMESGRRVWRLTWRARCVGTGPVGVAPPASPNVPSGWAQLMDVKGVTGETSRSDR